MKIVYIGELSGVRIDEICLSFLRGAAVEAPDEWAKAALLKDPERWRPATATESKALDDAAARTRAAIADAQRIADEISLAHAMEEDAKLRAIEEPATGGGGTGDAPEKEPAPVIQKPMESDEDAGDETAAEEKSIEE